MFRATASAYDDQFRRGFFLQDMDFPCYVAYVEVVSRAQDKLGHFTSMFCFRLLLYREQGLLVLMTSGLLATPQRDIAAYTYIYIALKK